MEYTITSSTLDPSIFASMWAVMETFSLFISLFSLLIFVCMWIIFKKAGEKGWKILIPFYNFFVFAKITKMPNWVPILVVIPGVNAVGLVIYQIMGAVNLAKVFGKKGSFAALIIFMPFIAYPILAFGKAKYVDSVDAVMPQQPVQQPMNQQYVPQQPTQPVQQPMNQQYVPEQPVQQPMPQQPVQQPMSQQYVPEQPVQPVQPEDPNKYPNQYY